jgi:hypothetical protein
MLYSYKDYLAKFYETLRRQGFPSSANAFHDLAHGIPRPLTREQFFECYIEAMEPFVRDGFIYSDTMKPFARAGFNYLNRTRRGGRKSAQARWGNQEDQRNRIRQAAITLLKNNPRRGLARAIKQRCGLTLSVQRINNILRRIGI